MTITFFSLKGLVESLFLWYDHPRNTLRAGVAQSAEQRFCKPQVGGSIPLASSILSTTCVDPPPPTATILLPLSIPGIGSNRSNTPPDSKGNHLP